MKVEIPGGAPAHINSRNAPEHPGVALVAVAVRCEDGVGVAGVAEPALSGLAPLVVCYVCALVTEYQGTVAYLADCVILGCCEGMGQGGTGTASLGQEVVEQSIAIVNPEPRKVDVAGQGGIVVR